MSSDEELGRINGGDPGPSTQRTRRSRARNGLLSPQKRRAPVTSASEEENDDLVELEQSGNGLLPVSSRRKGKRRKVVDEDEDEDEDEGEEEQEEDKYEMRRRMREASTNGKRRTDGTQNGAPNGAQHGTQNGTQNGAARKRGQATVISDEEEEEEGEEVEEGQRMEKRKRGVLQQAKRDKDDFVPGSIVRIKLHEFLTYSDVEFHTGSRLNMVIGANGTGKSSIVCGIAIGLGFPPSILGRAPTISSFVRQGSDEAYTEIELKGPIGKPNRIIRRDFNKSNKKSVWHLDGKESTLKAVGDTVHDLGIQVDNLCCFLPQDKVSSFAAMSPKELLQATMQAANETRLEDWHKTLCKAEEKLGLINDELETNQFNLEKVNKSVKDLEELVKAGDEKRSLEKRVDYLTLKVKGVEHNCQRDVAGEAKRESKELKAELKQIEKQNAPLERLRTELKSVKSKVAQSVRKAQDDHQDAEQDVQSLRTEIELEAESADGLQRQLAELKDNEQRRKTKLSVLQDRIRTSEQTLQDTPDPGDSGPLEKKRVQLKTERYQLDSQDQAMAQESADIQSGARNIQEELTRCRLGLEAANDVKKQRIALVQRRDPIAAYAIDWLTRNRQLFEKEVCLPAAVEVQLRDGRYGPLVESCLNRNQMHTFVAQTPNDYKTLNSLNDEQHWTGGRARKRVRINTYEITQRDMQEINEPSRVTYDDLAACNLDGFAMDFVQAPDAMIAYLRSARLHETAVSLRNANTELAPNKGLRRFVHHEGQGFVAVDVKISSYGSRAAQTTTTSIGPGNYFSVNADQNLIQRYQESIEMARRNQVQNEERLNALIAERKKRGIEREKLDVKLKKVDQEAEVIRAAARTIARAKTDRDNAQRELARLQREPPVQDQRQTLKRKLNESAKKRFTRTMKAMRSLKAMNKAAEDRSRGCLHLLQAQADLTHVESVHEARQVQIADVKAASVLADERFDGEKRRMFDLKQVFAQGVEAMRVKYPPGGLDAEILAELASGGQTVEEIQDEMLTTREELALLPETDNTAEETLRKEQRLQDELMQSVEKHTTRKAKYEKLFETTQAEFDPAIDAMVKDVTTRFAESLKAVNVAGEVDIERKDSYRDMALAIRVSFRDDEALQQLSRQRQSGGERSLSTIMYLMSLMAISRTPFSLVDEINQGMDQRNERAVHNQLVSTTCGGASGQYFLITPKLLTALDYKEGMKILVVNNGDWLPGARPGPRLGDMRGVLSQFRRGR